MPKSSKHYGASLFTKALQENGWKYKCEHEIEPPIFSVLSKYCIKAGLTQGIVHLRTLMSTANLHAMQMPITGDIVMVTAHIIVSVCHCNEYHPKERGEKYCKCYA